MDRDMFDDVAESAASNKSDNFKDGKGRALVLENVQKKMNEGITFVARVQVITSEAKGDMELAPFEPGKPHTIIQPSRVAPTNAPGNVLGWVQKLEKFKSAKGNVKAYILNLLGFKEAEITKDDFKSTHREMVSKEQPARGMLIDFTTYRQETQTGARKGEMKTYVNWINVPRGENPNDVNSNHPVQIARRRAELDKTAPITPE